MIRFSLTDAVRHVASFRRELSRTNDSARRICEERFLASRWEVVCHWILYHLHQLDWATVRSHAQLFKERHHQSTKTVERSRNTRLKFCSNLFVKLNHLLESFLFTYSWVDFNQYIFAGFDVNLEKVRSVQRRVHQIQQRLMRDIRPGRANIASVLFQYVSVRICVQQFNFLPILH